MMMCGSYLGYPSQSGRRINTGYKPAFVLVKEEPFNSTASSAARLRVSGIAMDEQTSAIVLPNGNPKEEAITKVDATGFQIDASPSSHLNNDGATYHWLSFAEGDVNCKVGAYKSPVTTVDVGFAPKMIWVLPKAAGVPYCAIDPGVKSRPLDHIEPPAGGEITSITANGFTVGGGANCNYPGVDHFWVAWSANGVKTGTYRGDGASRRLIIGTTGWKFDIEALIVFSPSEVDSNGNGTGVGGGPLLLHTRLCAPNVSLRLGAMPTSVRGILGLQKYASSSDPTKVVTSGFEVGLEANESGRTYTYAVWPK
jgi:hypothetical protein